MKTLAFAVLAVGMYIGSIYEYSKTNEKSVASNLFFGLAIAGVLISVLVE
jgi:hypothetical protein